MASNFRQSTASRQAEIIATVVALAGERNPAEITTTEIARAMKVTQGALFRHFPTKEAIRLAVVEWIETALMAELAAVRENAPDAVAALKGMFLAHVRFACKFPGVPRLVFAELQQPDESPVRQRVRQLMGHYRENLEGVFAWARETGAIGRDIDGHAAASLFLGAIQGLVIQSLLAGPVNDAEAQADAVSQLYFAGLESRP